MRERVRQLQELGCRRITDFLRLFWKLQGVYLPHYAVHLPHRVIDQRDRVMAAFGLLADESSRSEYVGEVRWRLLGDFDRLGEPVSTEIYFPDDLYRTTAQEAFVDCGAFDGDTIRRVFARHPDFAGSIHAFEPDPRNFSKLSAWAASLPPDLGRRIVLHQNAVGRRRETLRFNATGTESASVGEGSTEVEAVALDEALAGWRPSYIKMDTEGSEEDALHGAAATIRESEPALAICVYHRQNHLWEIPLLVRSLSTRYAIHLRPQLLEGWDLVCYAVPR
jgi:FkbM family methyltransferase